MKLSSLKRAIDGEGILFSQFEQKTDAVLFLWSNEV